MKWITRSNVKVDRVACPWLIRRFIDPQAEFLFVPEEELLEVAHREKAIPFDATRIPEVKLNHRGERCTFEAILEEYKLTDPVLQRLALIVRGADVKGQEHVSSEALGLRAIAHGFALTGISDEERLVREFLLYDALYARNLRCAVLPPVRAEPASKGFVQGVTAAAVGAIAGAAVILSKRALVDVPTVLIALISFGVLLGFKKIPEPILIVGAGVAGVVLHHGS